MIIKVIEETVAVGGSQQRQRVEEWHVTMMKLLAELHAKVDQLGTEVKSLGRRVERGDSSIHLEKFETNVRGDRMTLLKMLQIIGTRA